MATKGERQALFFLAAVALLGAATRVWRGREAAVDSTGVSSQIRAIDSLRVNPHRNASVTKKHAGKPARPKPAKPTNPPLVDLDVATAAEIEKLPGIGPSLAKRIVKYRDANGSFGCLAALDRVKGVGAAMLARIDTFATFSAGGGAPCASAGRPPGG